MNAVSGSGPDDVWAVGYLNTGSMGTYKTLILHWDGAAWTHVLSPNVGDGDNSLWGVWASAEDDAWAVGNFQNYESGGSLIMHWDGVQWSVVPSPTFEYQCFLFKVVALAPDNIWAVGSVFGGPNITHRTLVLHYDGQTWSVVPSPNVSNNHHDLLGVWANSPADMWAVGEYIGNDGWNRNLTMHWDGVSWSIVNTPSVGEYGNRLANVHGTSANDVWAVGYYNTGRATLALHWDGVQWNVVPTPNWEGMKYQDLIGVVALSPTNVWAVGHYEYPVLGTLIERFSNPCTGGTPTLTPTFTPTPSPTSSPTSFASGTATAIATSTSLTQTPYTSPTAVGTASTSTATITIVPTTSPEPSPEISPTACTLEFADVPVGSTFYSYVRCLACRDIISGYVTGCETGSPCFRPQNSVTRGQTAKIVSNAAGFSEIAGEQQFEDVEPGSTFYNYIWRLASRGYISGYACGIEPAGICSPPLDRPYFLPSSDVSRGQLAKIVSNAAEFAEAPTGKQFEDVATGSTFYPFTYRLALHEVMSGYHCGTMPAGLCVQPNNLPYFLPVETATRGQSAKIVANTFYPDCDTLSQP
jgi:hypothetical protein